MPLNINFDNDEDADSMFRYDTVSNVFLTLIFIYCIIQNHQYYRS